MIERLLAAERALADGRLEQAEHLFRQVAEADERNAIAVVGLAEVAMARGDRLEARTLATRALTIDPEDAAATRLLEAPTPVAATEAPATRPGASLGARFRGWLARLRGRSADGAGGAAPR